MKNLIIKAAFLSSIIIQAFHAVEEYLSGFLERFWPVRYLGEHFPHLVHPGFVVINILYISFGLYCFWRYSRKPMGKTITAVWIWILIGLFNGLAHITWALFRGSYVPGLFTAALQVLVMAVLITGLKRKLDMGEA